MIGNLELTAAEKDQLEAMWKAVDNEGAEKAMAFLHNYILKMKEAVIYTDKISYGTYPESAKQSNFDNLRYSFNDLLVAFHDWGECKELDLIKL